MDLQAMLEESGAILKGHFLLTSGRHSDVYVEKFRILEQPKVLTECARRIAEFFNDHNINIVAGPTTGGIIIAFEVARQMNLTALYVETEDGVKKLRRGAKVSPGARVLVVDDVFTTGTSVVEVVELLEGQGAEIAGVGVLIDRSQGPCPFPCPFFATHRVDAVSYHPDEVPNWLSEIPIIKPGTRVSDNKV
jgi:orotate phosphoribosyltransferase